MYIIDIVNKNKNFIKFLVVAGVNTLFGYSIYAVVLFIIKYVYLSVVVSNIISIFFNFKTYGTIVFKSSDNSKIFKFFGVYLFSMCFQLVMIKLLSMAGLKNPYLAGAILVLPSAGISFILMRRFVFSKKKKDTALPIDLHSI